MLTGTAKIFYLLAFSGFILLVQPTVKAVIGTIDGFDWAQVFVGTALLAVGYVLLQRDPTARSLGRRLYGAPPLKPGKDWVALFVILSGVTLLRDGFRKIWEGASFASEWPYFALVLVILGIGWFLALSEFRQSRSPQE
jgi:hypothetical protein